MHLRTEVRIAGCGGACYGTPLAKRDATLTPTRDDLLEEQATYAARLPWNGFRRKARMEAGNAWIVAAWILLHIVALATAYGTRVAAGSCLEILTQLLFFAAMLLVGGAIWICQQKEVGSWGLSGVTLIAMVLTAVLDFRRFGEARSVGQAF
jgi:hypothetical protein